MPRTVQQTLQDPQFYGLPAGEQQKVLATLDPNYARLPLAERTKVLQMGQQRLRAAPASGPATTVPDLTTNTINPSTGTGYGLYRMGSYDFNQGQVTKPEVQVPFNRVQDALTTGYQLHPDEAPRYQQDTSHTGPIANAAGQVKSLLSRMTEPMPDQPVTGSAWQQANAAMGNVEKLPFNVVNRTIRGVAGLPAGMAHTAAGISRGDPEALESLNPVTMGENAQRGLSADTSALGPVAALGNLGGDATTLYLTGKYGPRVVETATQPLVDVVRGTVKLPESVARVLTDTGAGPVKELVKKTEAANKDIDLANAGTEPKHLAEIQNSLHEQRGREIAYQQDVGNKTQEISQADQAEAAQLTRQQRVAEQKVAADNAQVIAKHQAVAQRVKAANAAAENALELRRQHEQAYQQATDTHYAKEAAADVKAKAEENQAWSTWRRKTSGKTLDGGQITGPLQKLRLDSPEVDRTLNQLEPRGDEVSQESPYAQIREQASQRQFGKDYESLSPVKQDQIDDLLHTNGYSPEPIAFDPQAGQPISIDRVQRASSILQRYIRSGRFEGSLLGEMKRVAGILRDAVTRASADVGAAKELESARDSTITYQGAFGREIKSPVTARTIREKQINPEAFQAREDEARLARARRYDPTLVDSYRQVKTTREALSKLPPEDQLRKDLRQVPASPTVGDTRPGFRLTAPLRAVPARLTSGAPAERAFQSIEQPLRPNFPDRPILEPRQTISAPDLVAARRAAAEARAGRTQTRGTWVATWPVFQAMRALWGGHIPSLPTMALESAGTYATTRAASALMRYPPLLDFLTQARPEDLALIPPDLRGDLPGLVNLAQRQGIKVAPALVAAAAGAGQQSRQITPAQAIQAMQPAPTGATQ